MKVLARPIEMISWTEEDGKIHPLKFKIENSLGEKQIVKIIKLYNYTMEKLAGNKIYKFTCEILVNNQIKICEIRYELDTCKWILFKI